MHNLFSGGERGGDSDLYFWFIFMNNWTAKSLIWKLQVYFLHVYSLTWTRKMLWIFSKEAWNYICKIDVIFM